MRKFFGKTLLCTIALCAITLWGTASTFAEISRLNINNDYSTAAIVAGKPTTINILITIETPAVAARTVRDPVAVSLVIDRSGSMDSARKLDYAILAGKSLVRSLDNDDHFALVTYDDKVNVLYPLGRITDKERIYRLLDKIQPGGYTFLSGGLEKGIEQFTKSELRGVRRVILLSDGLANQGVTNAERVAAIGNAARRQGVNVSTIGLGLDYDEDLMQLLAQRGGGQYYYVKNSEDLPSIFQRELSLANTAYTRELKARLALSPLVTDSKIYGYSTDINKNEIQVEMSDFSSSEKRQILLSLTFTPDPAVSTQQLGNLRLIYNDIDGNEQMVETSLAVNLAKTEAEAIEVNARAQEQIRKVEDEILIVQASEAQIAAMKALELGQLEEARKLLDAPAPMLNAAAPRNREVAAIAEQLQLAYESLDAASQDKDLMQDLIKESKNTAYQNAQGMKQGILLQNGDQGLLVEKLQKALADKGFYTGPINGIYSDLVTEAVKAYQLANSLTADGLAGPATQNSLGL